MAPSNGCSLNTVEISGTTSPTSQAIKSKLTTHVVYRTTSEFDSKAVPYIISNAGALIAQGKSSYTFKQRGKYKPLPSVKNQVKNAVYKELY